MVDKKISKRIAREINYFKSFPINMRYLLGGNLIYAFVLPVIELFVGAYIIGETNDNTLFVKYQLAVYTGIPFTFLLNGYLLRYIKIVRLYSFGILLSGVSMTVMMSLQELSLPGILIAGLIMGTSYGFFWANRDYMSLDVTDDHSRNYYFSLDTLFYTLTFIIVPAILGFLITFGERNVLYTRKEAYVWITIGVFILTVLATFLIHRARFNNPENSKFLFFTFHPLWRKMILFSISKGIMQGAILIFPTMLILAFFNTEESLGLLTSFGGFIAAIVLYLIGRYAKPEHRYGIYFSAIMIFTLGIALHSFLFSVAGVIAYQLLTYMSRPLHDVSYFPVEFNIIEIVSLTERRSQFTYILNHEFALYLGRITGCLIFLVIAGVFHVETALRYGLILIGTIMCLSIFLMKKLACPAN